METALKAKFERLWLRYFNLSELPLAFWYSDDGDDGDSVQSGQRHACVVGELVKARRGEKVVFDAASTACGGGRKYLGFDTELRPGFEYFLSCGIPGKMEGERYKKSPEIVREMMKRQEPFRAPRRYIVFKRWDRVAEGDEPEVVVFFAKPDVLSGLFALSGFEEADANTVISPFSAGCGTIAQYPYMESANGTLRAVLGGLDVSERPWLDKDVLTFAVPMARFVRMTNNMEESFLITRAWARVRERLSDEKGYEA